MTPITPTPNRTYSASLGMTMGSGGMVHTINGQSWPNVTPFQVAPDDQVQMTIVSSGMPMMSEYHPMHVHGHFFRLMNTVGGTTRPPLKDTVLIRPVGQAGASATVQMLMDNPGRWVFHCHNMEHMASGMMTAIEYSGDSDGDGIANRSDFEPRTAAPVTFLSEDAAAFRLGASDRVYVQWTEIINLNNGALGMVRQWQDMVYNSRYSHSYMESLPDFVKLAEAYGHVGMRITDLKDLKPKMEEAFAMKDRLVFLDIAVDTSEHVYPMQIKDGAMRDMWLSKTERT